MMRYVSTRGGAPAVGFTDAVLAGLAPDGGLYVPESWPTFSRDELAAFAGRPYAEVAAAVLHRFAGEALSAEACREMCEEAYASFTHKAVVPLTQIAPNGWLAELFHGPSLAFKDVAMQLLARLYDRFLAEQRRSATILVATSGDTGGAAVEAFRGRSNIRVVALYPEGRISEVQRRFMTTAVEANVRCVSIDGDFDDCQALLKQALADPALRQSSGLVAVNSINFARIVAQAAYYFTTGVALGAPHREVAYAVPSGNFGDAFAGYVAKQMGLPIRKIIAATNANDILAKAFQQGRYQRGQVAATKSPAMDIQSASNFERLYFECVRRDGVETARAFAAFSEAGRIDIPPAALAAMRETFAGATISEADTVKTMLATLNETGVLIDPHTAVGVAAMNRAGDLGAPVVVMSTAHPAKFPETVVAATGMAPPLPRGHEGLAQRPERADHLAADLAAVGAYVRNFASA